MLEKDGNLYARVTEVIADLNDFAGVDPLVLSRKGKIGTEVHGAIHEMLTDNFPVVSSGAKGYFESFLTWAEETEAEFELLEHRFFCDKLMITGQIDAIVSIGGSSYILDYKTSASESKTWEYQAHFYHYLAREAGWTPNHKVLFLQLKKTGALPKLYRYPFQQQRWEDCLRKVENFWKNSPTENST